MCSGSNTKTEAMKSEEKESVLRSNEDDVPNPSDEPKGFMFRTVCAKWVRRTVHPRKGVLASDRQSRTIDTQLSALPK